MSKRFIFLISFVVVLGLAGSAPAASIDVNNGSFEYDADGAQITEWTGLDDVLGWTLRDTTGWAGGWWGVDANWGLPGYVAADGNVASFNVTGGDPCDPNEGICDIYQILDPNLDANAVIAANHRYTLTFNAIRTDATATPIAYGALFYSSGGVNVPQANDVTLASEWRKLTAPTFGQPDYAGWEEIKISYTALTGAGSIGETLGVKLSNPYPWIEGYPVAMDNVRVEQVWATDAWDPIPEDGAEGVAKSPTLKWKPGVWVDVHNVYFGTSYAEVYDANTNDTEYKNTQDANSYTLPGTLDLGKTYYWRIDEVNDAYGGSDPPPGPWKGDVWSFEVTGYATDPYPADDEEGVPFLDLTLEWTAGTDATSHDVYFGTGYSEVDSANTSTSGIYRDNRTDPNYTVPESATGLTAGRTYYWRIDERSAAYLLKGKIWSFTIGEFLVVDDFDGYANQNELWAVWDDYWVNYSDAYIYLETDPQLGRDGNSLRYEYINTSYSTKYLYTGSWIDAQDPAELEVGSDWTVGGVKALTLYFSGDPCNTFGGKTGEDLGGSRLWIELEDTSTNTSLVQHTDVNEMKEAEYHEWNIALKEFSDAGVDLSALDRVTIGIGGYANGGQGTTAYDGASGQIRIDDILLYPPRCLPEYAQIVGNLNGDCIVDNDDLGIFSGDWLVSDYNTPAAPPASPPEVWYRFDEGSGSTVLRNDGSWGSAYDIVISYPNGPCEPNWTDDVAPAVDVCDPNYALDFDGTDDYLEIPNSPATNFSGTQNMTITTWIKGTPAAWDSWVCSARGSGDRHATGIGTMGANEFGYFWNESEWWWNSGLTIPTGQWAFTAVAIEPTQATAYVYNGTTLSNNTNTVTHGSLEEFGTDDFTVIGSDARTTTFDGIIDDVRLYNKTLTIGEIMGLAGITGEVYIPNDSSANFAPKTPPPTNYDPNDPDIVNLVDYEVLADNWLSEYLWPPE